MESRYVASVVDVEPRKNIQHLPTGAELGAGKCRQLMELGELMEEKISSA